MYCQYCSLITKAKNNIGVYKSHTRKLNERALFTVSLENRLAIIEENKNAFKILDENGRIGCIEKRMVTKQKGSKCFTFDNAYIDGYIDLPSIITIFDSDQKMAISIKLDRSFKDCFLVNIDKESIKRRLK